MRNNRNIKAANFAKANKAIAIMFAWNSPLGFLSSGVGTGN